MSALTVLNPATAQPIATLERADVAEVDAAVSRAAVAQRRWAALPPGARADQFGQARPGGDLGGALGLCLRGQQHGGGARRGHRLEVLLRQERGAHVPHPLARTLEVGGEAHHGQVRVVRSHARAPNR